MPPSVIDPSGRVIEAGDQLCQRFDLPDPEGPISAVSVQAQGPG